jgi:hypothetical protein
VTAQTRQPSAAVAMSAPLIVAVITLACPQVLQLTLSSPHSFVQAAAKNVASAAATVAMPTCNA